METGENYCARTVSVGNVRGAFPVSEAVADEVLAQLNEGVIMEAVEKLSQILKRNPRFGKAYNHLGWVYETKYKNMQRAEEYYRAMFRGRPNTWNLRDRHMFETLEILSGHLGSRLGREARIIVWAHNSHLGNAAATEMGQRGEINIGQLVTEKYADKALRIGFSTSRGKVTAATDWDGPAETAAAASRRTTPPGRSS